MSRNLKKILVFVFKLLVSSALLYIVLSRAGIEKVLSLLKNINPLSFIFAVFLYIAGLFAASIRWKLLLDEKFSLRRLFPLYLLGSFFSTFLPGLVGGDAVKAYYIYKETGKGTQALASVFMDRYIGFSTLMVVGMIVFPFGREYFKGLWIEWLLPLIVLSFVVVSFLIFGLRLGKKIKFLSDFYGYFHSYRKKPDLMVKTFLLSAVVQVLIIYAVYILAQGLGEHIPLRVLFIFVPIIVALSTLPVSISGIGVREASFVLLLSSIGIGADAAAAISFAWFLSISAGGLLGLYEYFRHKDYAQQPEE